MRYFLSLFLTGVLLSATLASGADVVDSETAKSLILRQVKTFLRPTFQDLNALLWDEENGVTPEVQAQFKGNYFIVNSYRYNKQLRTNYETVAKRAIHSGRGMSFDRFVAEYIHDFERLEVNKENITKVHEAMMGGTGLEKLDGRAKEIAIEMKSRLGRAIQDGVTDLFVARISDGNVFLDVRVAVIIDRVHRDVLVIEAGSTDFPEPPLE